MNWFIGVVVDPTGWYPAKVPPLPDGFRAFHPEDLHLTIAFLANAGESKARAAWDALKWPIGPIRAELGELVPMGSKSRYSALSVLLEKGRLPIEGAIGQVRDAACNVAGATPDIRPPKAHVTIARPARSATDVVRKAGLAWAKTVNLRGTPVLLDRIALYTWAEDRKERLFRKVAERSTISASAG